MPKFYTLLFKPKLKFTRKYSHETDVYRAIEGDCVWGLRENKFTAHLYSVFGYCIETKLSSF